MIGRYTRPEMGAHWSQENIYATWLEVELAAVEACARVGLIPNQAANMIRENARFDVRRIAELEEQTKHDVIAFVTCVAENLGDAGRFLHYGLTSSDVLDTSLALLLSRALEKIMSRVENLRAVFRRKAMEFKDTLQIGRSHGIHAEPITFGLKLALYYEELKRHSERLAAAKRRIAIGKLSGAVGTYAHLPPEVEKLACQKLGLAIEPIATQIVHRDRHAEVFCTLALLAGTLEKMAIEIRHLQRTEVGEAEEGFVQGQKGSSAMPHKRNPIAAENMTGCARLMRSYAQAALENIALWHERDISHSSVERVIAPDATILMDYMLARMTRLIEDLVVYPEKMQANLERSAGLLFSQALLLHLVEKGLSREQAYHLVQRNAMKVLDQGGSLESWVLKDEELVKVLTPEKVREIFDLTRYVRHRDEMFQRVFEDGKEKK